MWDHTTRLCHYCNDAVHSIDSKQVAQFKIDALEREKERIKNIHEEMYHKLHKFQSRHLERLTDIEQLHCNRQKCWADLARLYLEEAENCITPIEATIDQYLHGHAGVGYPVRLTPRSKELGIVAPSLFRPLCVEISSVQAQLK
jgi:hypothetical protein